MFAKWDSSKDCEREGSRNVVETAIDNSKDRTARWDSGNHIVYDSCPAANQAKQEAGMLGPSRTAWGG